MSFFKSAIDSVKRIIKDKEQVSDILLIILAVVAVLFLVTIL